MRRIGTVLAVAVLTVTSPLVATSADAAPAKQLTTAQLRALVLTTEQAIAATGFTGELRPAAPTGFRCGRQKPSRATYCSRMWDSPTAAAHPSLVTAASFSSAAAARAQIRDELKRGRGAGTVVRSSATAVVYYVSGVPDLGTAAIAQQAIGSRYAFAWCSIPADLAPEPAVTCAEDLLAAQAARIRGQ